MTRRVDLIEIHVALERPTTPQRAEAIGKRLATALRIVARDKEKIANVVVADVRGDE